METVKSRSLMQGLDLHNKRQIRKVVVLLAWPAIMEMLLSTMVQFVDTVMVGSLGEVAIASVGINNTPMWVLMGMFASLGVGSTALVAQFIGAEDYESANKVAQQSFQLGASLALLVTLLALFFAEQVPILMGAEEEVIPLAASYLRIISLSFVFTFLSFILSGVLRGSGDTSTPMKVNTLANLFNIVANFYFIFPSRLTSINLPLGLGHWEFYIPGAGMGVKGAAIATSLARGFAGLFILFVLFSGRKNVKLFLTGWRFEWDTIMAILRIGLPISAERLLSSSGQLVFSSIILRLGTVSYASHYLVYIAESISFMPGHGFSMAATTLVGQGLGAKQPKLAEACGFIVWRMGASVMIGMGVIFFLFPEFIIKIFNSDPEILKYGSMGLRMVGLSQFPLATSMILTGALRGAGDTMLPLVITGIGMWPVRLGLSWLLVFKLNMGLMGAYLGMVADLWVRGVFTYLRFRSGFWKSGTICRVGSI
ncbi:MAG: MATE family efflux transporter [Firmicutes bacterium]|nr:MATE family efflux transporter [Bacillota bacterium]